MRIIVAVLAIAMVASTAHSYGPTRRSLSFSLTLGPSFTWSTFAEQEDKFAKDLNFYLYRTDPSTGARDSSLLRYSYYDFSGEGWVMYYPSDAVGAGLFYRGGQVSQKVHELDWNGSSGLLTLHRVGLVMQYWPDLTDEFGFSFFIPAGAALGELYRLPVLESNYQNPDAMRGFIQAAHETVKCNGVFSGLSVTVSHRVGRFLSAAIIVDYEWAWVRLTGDKTSGYPQNDFLNEIGVKAGLLLLTARSGVREIY